MEEKILDLIKKYKNNVFEIIFKYMLSKKALLIDIGISEPNIENPVFFIYII